MAQETNLPIPVNTENHAIGQMEESRDIIQATVVTEPEQILPVMKSFDTTITAGLSIKLFKLNFEYHKAIYIDGKIINREGEEVSVTKIAKLGKLLSRNIFKKTSGQAEEEETKQKDEKPYQSSSQRAISKRSVRRSSSKTMIVDTQFDRYKSFSITPRDNPIIINPRNDTMNMTNLVLTGNDHIPTADSVPLRNKKMRCKFHFSIKNNDEIIIRREEATTNLQEVNGSTFLEPGDFLSTGSSVIPDYNIDEAYHRMTEAFDSAIIEDSSPVNIQEVNRSTLFEPGDFFSTGSSVIPYYSIDEAHHRMIEIFESAITEDPSPVNNDEDENNPFSYCSSCNVTG